MFFFQLALKFENLQKNFDWLYFVLYNLRAIIEETFVGIKIFDNSFDKKFMSIGMMRSSVYACFTGVKSEVRRKKFTMDR
jgi:ABC-type proline/glycine betaine transport system permease subunit